MSCWKPWPAVSVPGCTPTHTIRAAGRRIIAKLWRLLQSIKLIPHRDCRTEAVAKAHKIERSLGSSFTVSVSDAVVAFPNPQSGHVPVNTLTHNRIWRLRLSATPTSTEHLQLPWNRLHPKSAPPPTLNPRY
jgi:hypothetical protein